jgi:DNA polymerase III subunit delta
MDSLTFLEKAPGLEPQPLYALYGDGDFLKRLVVAALHRIVLPSEIESFGFTTYTGDTAEWAAVNDELHTLPFLGPRRLIVIENADPFVSEYRGQLESYASAPSASAVLVLVAKTWTSTTRLARMLDNRVTIECKTPPAYRLPDWCRNHAAAAYDKQISVQGARLLVDLVGPEMGQLDQELAKLAAYAGKAKSIEVEDVDKLVGSSRAENMWKIFDAIGAGDTATALGILDRVFDQGDEPIRILGAFSMQLRRLTQVARLTEQGRSLGQAADEAGIPPFAQRSTEQQLRHLGRRRLDQLYDWLIEVDLGLKGSSPLTPRTLLERLIVRLGDRVTVP